MSFLALVNPAYIPKLRVPAGSKGTGNSDPDPLL